MLLHPDHHPMPRASHLLKHAVQGMLAVVAPVLVGFAMGPAGLSGLLTGAIISGSMLVRRRRLAQCTHSNPKRAAERLPPEPTCQRRAHWPCGVLSRLSSMVWHTRVDAETSVALLVGKPATVGIASVRVSVDHSPHRLRQAGRLGCRASQAVMMSNAGGAWDNTKKYIEGGAHGGKGSDCHKVPLSMAPAVGILPQAGCLSTSVLSMSCVHSCKGLLQECLSVCTPVLTQSPCVAGCRSGGHGGRPLQGHQRAGAQHSHQADVNHLPRARPSACSQNLICCRRGKAVIWLAQDLGKAWRLA